MSEIEAFFTHFMMNIRWRVGKVFEGTRVFFKIKGFEQSIFDRVAVPLPS